MSDAPQPTTSFAKGHTQAVDMFHQKVIEDGIYGALPAYSDNPTNWESRMRMRLKSWRQLNKFGLAPKDMTTTIILDDTFTHTRERGCMGNEEATFAEFRSLCRAHVRRREQHRQDNLEQQERREAVIAYGELLGVPQVEISRILVRVRTKAVQWVDECKRELDIWKRQHAEPLPDTSKVYADGFEPDVEAAMKTSKEYEAKQAKTQPPQPREQPVNLNAVFPRDASGEPIDDLPQEGNVSDLQDTLTSVADEQAAQDKPKHFSQLDGFYKKIERLFTKRRQSAVLGTDKYMAKAHELMGVKSFTELIDITEAEFLSMLDDRLKVFCETSKQKQDEPKSDKTEKIDEKATPQGDSAPIGLDTQSSSPVGLPGNISSSELGNVIPFPQSNVQLPRTITGISVLNIGKELNKHLPPEAYGAIKHGQMTGKTDIDGDAVRDRFDQVFGSLMWRIVPQQLAGRIEYTSELRKGQKGELTWHICTLIAHQFQYALIMPDGAFQWVDGMVTSDLHDNTDQQYCYRGAMTSLMKQFYKLMGGMNHVIYDEYTHVHAQQEIAQRKRKSA